VERLQVSLSDVRGPLADRLVVDEAVFILRYGHEVRRRAVVAAAVDVMDLSLSRR
jgi:hypothetical protein